VHRLESAFSKIEFQSENKWQVFENPFKDTFVSNNDVVNFSFGYTYVGRQNYDKWVNYDSTLEYPDVYNYETLEWAFQVNLNRPQTIPYSPEFIAWCNDRGVKPITNQIPIGIFESISERLTSYREIVYRNSVAGNGLELKTNT
jgi:hypothetical protein